MVNKKVLVLGTYPIVKPLHGGQKRVAAIYRKYQQQAKAVRYVAVYNSVAYAHASKNDIAVSEETLRKIEKSPHEEDVLCGRAIAEDKKVREKIEKLLRSFRPDIIQVEQVYPYLGLESVVDNLGMKPIIINSTHNVEHEMKREIYESTGVPKERRLKQLASIKKNEEHLAKMASLSIAVSGNDAGVLKKMGAKNVILAPNGIDPILPAETNRVYWMRKFEMLGIDKFALFVSSAHIPNWMGFVKAVGFGIGFLAPEEKLVLAGGIGDLARRDTAKFSPLHAVFWKRAITTGRLEEGRLQALLSLAEVVLLPVTEGGGSNLKTAEALITGKKIVATPYAFRAYEEFMDYPNVYLANDQVSFRSALRKALDSAPKPFNQAQNKAIEKVLWDNCLQEAMEKVATL